MSKNLDISLLFDFYGEMLTEKQRGVVELYYNADLSLAEIAEHSGITRQGVRDSVKRAENQLLEFEEKLGLLSRFHNISEGLDEITRHTIYLMDESRKLSYSSEFYKKLERISELAGTLNI